MYKRVVNPKTRKELRFILTSQTVEEKKKANTIETKRVKDELKK